MKALVQDVGTRAVTLPGLLGVILLVSATLTQLRLLSFALLLFFGVLYAFWPRCRHSWGMVVGCVIFVVSLFLPFDVAFGTYYWGHRSGSSPGGPHFVRFVVGYPKHTYLLRTYGEYIGGGCTWPAIIPPGWVLVWN